jgi:hypothetical protein
MRSTLEMTERLIVVGYSFRDRHVNELVRTWLGRDLKRRLTIISPNFPERLVDFAHLDFRKDLYLYLKDRDGRGFEDRLTIFRETASQALGKALALN